MIRRQIVGGTSARSRRCYASGRAGRGRGAGFRGVHVRIVAVPVSTAAAADGVASRPSSADQPASADGTTVRSPPQRRQPECRHGHYIQPEPATGSTRRGAGGAEGRKPHGLLQPRTPGGEVPAHLPGAGPPTVTEVRKPLARPAGLYLLGGAPAPPPVGGEQQFAFFQIVAGSEAADFSLALWATLTPVAGGCAFSANGVLRVRCSAFADPICSYIARRGAWAHLG